MNELIPFSLPGRFLRGNTHSHTTHSDGALPLEHVVQRYKESGYDFLAITDHFLPAYGFPLTDARPYQTERFTPISGVELHAPRTANSALWHITALGLPYDFPPRRDDEDGPALARRAAQAGAFITLVHPAWYSLSLEDAATIEVAHAVEIYNHGCQIMHDKGDGAYLLDGLLDRGHRMWATAVDDAHFKSPDFGAAWLQLKSASRESRDIVQALKDGHFYSTQGPEIHSAAMDDEWLEIECSSVASVLVVGCGYLMAHQFATSLTRARISLAPLAQSPWLRVVLTGADGRRAWTNPVWRA
jgi:hypothetical protein